MPNYDNHVVVYVNNLVNNAVVQTTELGVVSGENWRSQFNLLREKSRLPYLNQVYNLTVPEDNTDVRHGQMFFSEKQCSLKDFFITGKEKPEILSFTQMNGGNLDRSDDLNGMVFEGLLSGSVVDFNHNQYEFRILLTEGFRCIKCPVKIYFSDIGEIAIFI